MFKKKQIMSNVFPMCLSQLAQAIAEKNAEISTPGGHPVGSPQKLPETATCDFFLKKNMFLTTKVVTDSSQLCVGFLFLILYPGSLPPPASLLPPPSACHTPSLTYNNFTHTNLTYNFVTYHTSHTQT